MTTISEVFNGKIPTKSEVKKSFKSKGKDYNIKLLINLRKECMELSDKNYYKVRVINNIFDYLDQNVSYRKVSDIERIVYELLKINEVLIDKQQKDNNNSVEFNECINRMKNNISILLNRMSNGLRLDCEDLIKMTLFNRLMYDIFNKRKLKDILNELIYNVEILNYHNFNGENFDDLLDREYNRAVHSNNKGLMEYYISLMKYVVMIPGLHVDKEKYFNIIRGNVFDLKYSNYRDPLQDKLANLEYHEKSHRYKLVDEFTFTIDSDKTKNFDDAFSIEKKDNKLLVGIHVADVVSLGFDKEVVLGEKPFVTSAGYHDASLKMNSNRNTVSVFLEIDENGIIEDYKLVPTKINSKYNMKFSEAASIIFEDKNNLEFNKLPNEIKKTFLEKINLLFEFYTLIGNKNLSDNIDCNNFGYLLSAKLNILYNCVVSAWFEENGYPYIYLNGNNIINQFSMTNTGFDTGFKSFNAYGRASSPIVEKASLISQIMIHNCCFKKPTNREVGRYEKMLEPFVKKLNNKY